MPFTPVHMGPGIFIKSLLQGSFSVMIFGWSQIVMEIQPLVVLVIGEGYLHGFSHTFIGASMIAIFSALAGKGASEYILNKVVRCYCKEQVYLKWHIVIVSAFIGTFSHVLLDAIMHFDVQPYFSITLGNPFLGLLSIEVLHMLCLIGGFFGVIIYLIKNRNY